MSIEKIAHQNSQHQKANNFNVVNIKRSLLPQDASSYELSKLFQIPYKNSQQLSLQKKNVPSCIFNYVAMSIPPSRVINVKIAIKDPHYKTTREAIIDGSQLSLAHKEIDIDVCTVQ